MLYDHASLEAHSSILPLLRSALSSYTSAHIYKNTPQTCPILFE